MKIAINTRFLLPNGLEGIGRYTQEISKRLVALCPDDEFIFLFDRKFEHRYIFGENVSGVVIHPQARHPILWYWWFEKSLPSFFKKNKVDLFISMDGYCSLKSPVPTIMVIHDLAYVHYPDQIKTAARKYYQKWVPRFCKRADKLVTISRASQADLVEQYQMEKKEIGIIPNGYNPKFSPLTPEQKLATRIQFADGEKYFCTLGAIHPRKNIEGTIHAFDKYKSISKSKDKLLIIGRMAWKNEKLKNTLDNSPNKSDIKLLGYLPDEEVRFILGSSKALLFLSFFEGFGVPLLEAMQLKIPTIYSNLSVMPEIAGDTGIPVNPKDLNEVSNAMMALKDFETETVQKLREEKLKAYNWDRAAQLMKRYVDAVR